jgi:allantoinase
MLDLVVRAPRAVVDGSERACSVGVREGRIEVVDEYGAGLDALSTELLGDDVVLIPGLVDTHVHVNEPGRAEWEGFRHATRAAARGGVTTIVDMPLNSVPPTTSVSALDEKRVVAEGSCFVDVGFWGGAVPGNADDLRPLWDAGVLGFKGFLCDSGVEEFPALDGEDLLAAARVVAGFGGLLLVHAEDPSALSVVPAGRSCAGFAATRPPAAEVSAVRTVAEAARTTGCRMHVVHLAAADALPVLRATQAAGVPVTAETCPHYLTFAAEEVPDGSTAFKCCPPVRDAANRDRLWDGVADGTLSMVVTDHSPSPPERKALDAGSFDEAWGGISSLQLGLSATWTEALVRGHSLADVVRWTATGPADLVGLGHKGRIVPGADADLVAFAPEQTFEVDPARLEHRHPVTPYAGRKLTGLARRTWLRGRPVDLDGEPTGRLLRRGER